MWPIIRSHTVRWLYINASDGKSLDGDKRRRWCRDGWSREPRPHILVECEDNRQGQQPVQKRRETLFSDFSCYRLISSKCFLFSVISWSRMYCPAHGSLENVSLKMDRAGRFTATGVWHPHPHFWSLRLFLTWIKRRSAEEDLQRHFTRSPLQELQSALLECFIPSQLTDLCSVICPHWGVHWRRLRLRKKWQMGGKEEQEVQQMEMESRKDIRRIYVEERHLSK